MSEEIWYIGAAELADRIRLKQLSPVEIIEAFHRRIDAVNPGLNAIVTLADGTVERAREAETAISRGESWGPLHGVPFTIKDCIDTAGIRTTRGSLLFEDHVPTVDASVVQRLVGAGGILIGKTNMPEFALWWETGNLVFGRTENPWKEGRTPGGSSGGEAAAIAAGLSPLGVGSDVGGSIRQPAHYCGIVGLKPTHGRVPLTGHWPDTLLRFMHVGPMARTVRDVALGLSVLSGPDGCDPYAIDVPPARSPAPDTPLPPLRIAWCADGPFSPLSSDVRATVARAASALEELGCRVEPVSLDRWTDFDPQAISMALYSAEGSHYLGPIISDREDLLAPSMQRRIKAPQPTFQDYLEALSNLELLRQETARLLSLYDLLLCPTGVVPAHPHESAKLSIEGQSVPGRNALRATIPADLTGSPAISVPFGWSTEGLPIGVQLIARHFDEYTLLLAASALEGLTDCSRRHPPV
jgi:aspartyl-tRNA(Asn)/glutamyl-tRNA(Gln) amidotransferase subunit A